VSIQFAELVVAQIGGHMGLNIAFDPTTDLPARQHESSRRAVG
jgi:hypothetical protein